MGTTYLGNIRGPQGYSVASALVGSDGHVRFTMSTGTVLDAGDVRGPQGLPGVNAVSNDAAVAGYVSTTGASATKDALAAAFGAGAMVDAGLIPRRPMDNPPKAFYGKVVAFSTATIAAGGSGYAVNDEITLAGGVGDAPTVVKVSSVSAGAVTAVTSVITGIYTTAPTNPTAQASTTGVGTGATLTVSWTGNARRNRSPVILAATDAKFRFTGNGPGNISASGYYGNTSGNGTASLWEWESDAPNLDIKLGGLNTNATLSIDGQRLSVVPVLTAADGAQYIISLQFGGAQRMRSYRLFSSNSGFGGVSTGATDTVRAPSSVKPLAWGLGDSYMYGNGADNIALAAFNVMCEQLGLEGLPDGIGGAGWTGSTAGTPQARIAAKLVPLTRAPAYVFLDMGYNNSAATDMTTITTPFNESVAAVQAAWPSAKIVVFGPATPLGDTAGLAAIRTAIQGRCTALALTFIDVVNWVNADNKARYTGVDNTHPTALGHLYLGARKADAVRKALNI